MTENQTSKAVESLLSCCHMDIDMWNAGYVGQKTAFPERLKAIAEKYKKMEKALERIGQPIESRPMDSEVDAGTFYISQATDKVCIAQEVLAFDPLK